MAWLRLDDGFAGSPAIVNLTDREFRLFIRLLCHCSRYSRSIVDEAPRREVRGLRSRSLARFATLGLLSEIRPNTYEVRDWALFRPGDPTAAERQARPRARAEGLACATGDGLPRNPPRSCPFWFARLFGIGCSRSCCGMGPSNWARDTSTLEAR